MGIWRTLGRDVMKGIREAQGTKKRARGDIERDDDEHHSDREWNLNQ